MPGWVDWDISRGGDEAQSRRMRKITENGKHGEDEEEEVDRIPDRRINPTIPGGDVRLKGIFGSLIFIFFVRLLCYCRIVYLQWGCGCSSPPLLFSTAVAEEEVTRVVLIHSLSFLLGLELYCANTCDEKEVCQTHHHH